MLMLSMIVCSVYLLSVTHAQEEGIVDASTFLGFVDDFAPTGGTMCHNKCSGHGRCISNGNGAYCDCDLGWGNINDIAEYRDPKCALRSCPAGDAWASAAIARGGHNAGLTTGEYGST